MESRAVPSQESTQDLPSDCEKRRKEKGQLNMSKGTKKFKCKSTYFSLIPNKSYNDVTHLPIITNSLENNQSPVVHEYSTSRRDRGKILPLMNQTTLTQNNIRGN